SGPPHLSQGGAGEPRRRSCTNPWLLFDDESCPPDRSACTGGLAEHFGATGSWPLRAILQCPFWAIRSFMAEPLLCLHARRKTLVVSAGLRGAQSGTGRDGGASCGVQTQAAISWETLVCNTIYL